MSRGAFHAGRCVWGSCCLFTHLGRTGRLARVIASRANNTSRRAKAPRHHYIKREPDFVPLSPMLGRKKKVCCWRRL